MVALQEVKDVPGAPPLWDQAGLDLRPLSPVTSPAPDTLLSYCGGTGPVTCSFSVMETQPSPVLGHRPRLLDTSVSR